MNRLLHLSPNTAGRDIAVGDIHGHFTRLQDALDAAGFDASCDRLFSVGDLVDRGPESEQSLEWLDKPWFFAVQGNHEALAIAHVCGGYLDYSMYRASGGGWFLDLARQDQEVFASRFDRMPLAIELETAQGLVALVHADCPFPSWAPLRETFVEGGPLLAAVQEICQWSRRRLQQENTCGVEGVRALIVGHTPLRQVAVLGNVYHIDTAGWASGYFTLLDLNTLEALPTS
ncbi:metallophosphoesterase [Pseudomonas sp. LS1212]|uniref:metallophosphoesterase n=1 Tax=Pseudomonas sp. LS1212 TaxID=2972478 RepID=UPI00215CCFFA|nr:metallophosphoesterase [Pseudomonas sp. LS1212]UVJ45897.1 metallophosphoesterase [Pseudomonas sp. LS1212]